MPPTHPDHTTVCLQLGTMEATVVSTVASAIGTTLSHTL